VCRSVPRSSNELEQDDAVVYVAVLEELVGIRGAFQSAPRQLAAGGIARRRERMAHAFEIVNPANS